MWRTADLKGRPRFANGLRHRAPRSLRSRLPASTPGWTGPPSSPWARRGAASLLLGCVAQKVIAHAACPVVTWRLALLRSGPEAVRGNGAAP